MEVQELEARIVELERRLKELSTSVSINMEWLAEIREMLVQLLQILRRKQELSWERPRSALESSSSNFSRSKSDAMLEKCVNLIFKDYREQFRE
jgi:hypothetical protein